MKKQNKNPGQQSRGDDASMLQKASIRQPSDELSNPKEAICKPQTLADTNSPNKSESNISSQNLTLLGHKNSTMKGLNKQVQTGSDNIQTCLNCGHYLDYHLEQINGKAIAGQCLLCECKKYSQQTNTPIQIGSERISQNEVICSGSKSEVKTADTFCLSNEIWNTEMTEGKMIYASDVKEFIRLLKKKLEYTNVENNCKIIDKLAGEKLL